MLGYQEKFLNLLSMARGIKKYVVLILCLIVSISSFVGCGTQTLAEKGIDEIVIYTSHYAREDTEITVSITEEDTIEEMLKFFDKLEYKNNPEGKTPDDYYGAGKDVVYFKKDGKVVKQCTIRGSFIIDEEEKESGEWDFLSDDCRRKWDGYVNDIVLGKLGTLLEE